MLPVLELPVLPPSSPSTATFDPVAATSLLLTAAADPTAAAAAIAATAAAKSY